MLPVNTEKRVIVELLLVFFSYSTLVYAFGRRSQRYVQRDYVSSAEAGA